MIKRGSWYGRKQSRRPLAEINVVPYIDVMLVLLVIFMITAPLLTQGIQVKLPRTAARALAPDKDLPIVVSVDRQGQYFLNMAPEPQKAIEEQALLYRVSGLLALAQQQHISRPVYVKGDRDVNYGAVVKVMALLQHAGAGQVGLITDSEAED